MRYWMSLITGCLLLFTVNALAQAPALPDAPSESVSAASSNRSTPSYIQDWCNGSLTNHKCRPSKTLDARFLTIALGHAAATAFDIQSTIAGQKNGARELNPLVGPRPSAARLYSFGIPLTAAGDVGMYYLKKHNKKWWWVPGALGIGVHVVAASLNMRSH